MGRYQYLWVCPMLFLQMIDILLIGITPSMMNSYFGDSAFLIIGIFSGIQGFLAFLGKPIVGSVSDLYGRKPMIVASAVVTSVPSLMLLMFAPHNMWPYEIAVAAIGPFFNVFALAFAYVADVTEHGPERATAMGATVSSLGFTLAVLPLTGSWINRHYGNKALFRVVALARIVTIAYTLLMPESLRRSIRTERMRRARQTSVVPGAAAPSEVPPGDSSWRAESLSSVDSVDRGFKTPPSNKGQGRMSTVDTPGTPKTPALGAHVHADVSAPLASPARRSVCSAIGTAALDGSLWRLGPILWRHPLLRRLAIITFLTNVSENALIVLVWPYLNKRLGWTASQESLLASVHGISMFFVQAVLLRIMAPRMMDRSIVLIGLTANAIHAVMFAVASNNVMVWSITPFAGLTWLVWPTLSHMVSENVSSTEQGVVQGAFAGLRALTNGFGPVLFGALMDVTLDNDKVPARWDGAAFYVGAVMVLIALALAVGLPTSPSRAQGGAHDGVEASSPVAGVHAEGPSAATPLLANSGGEP